MKNTVSVITPTFKGGCRLTGVFDSIKCQTYPAKEWIIILDGYDLPTLEVVNELRRSASFPVFCEVIEHNHKKAAVNRGVKLATGEFVLIADDDDVFPNYAIQTLIDSWNTLSEQKKKIAVGVTGLCENENKEIVGDKFPRDMYFSDAIECSLKKRVKGEKWGMQRTEIMRMYPYFEEAEGYVGESTVWLLIAKNYKTLYINKVVRTYNYNPSSIINSKNDLLKIFNNCQAYVYGYKFTCENFFWNTLSYPRYFLACSINYCRYYFHAKKFKKYKPWMSPFSSVFALSSFLVGLLGGALFFIRDNRD